MTYTIEQLSQMVETLQKQLAEISDEIAKLPDTYAAKLTWKQLDTTRAGQISDVSTTVTNLTDRVIILEGKP